MHDRMSIKYISEFVKEREELQLKPIRDGLVLQTEGYTAPNIFQVLLIHQHFKGSQPLREEI